MTSRSQSAPVFAAGALAALLAVVIYGYVFSNGLCCADDSTNAIVAKNLALGRGYANSVAFDGPPGLKLFDPGITTGPTLNIPAAILIRLFGNLPWVPGFVTATASLLLLLVVGLAVALIVGRSRSAAYVCVLMFLLYSVTADLHFEQWYALLGDMPAALLSIAAAAILAVQPDRRSVIAAAALVCGLATMTKVLALLSFVPICIWFIWRAIRTKSSRTAVDLLTALAGFALPMACFEAWRAISLGFRPYLHNSREFAAFFLSRVKEGPGSDAYISSIGPIQRFAIHSAEMYQHFGFSSLGLLAVLFAITALLHNNLDGAKTRLLFRLLAGGALTNAAWWLFFSNGWPRYALIGLCLYFAAISCVVFTTLRWQLIACMTLLMLVNFSASSHRLLEPPRFVMANKFRYTPRVNNLLKTVAFLKKFEQDRPFVIGWWGTAVDLEYSMPEVGSFVRSTYIDVNHHKSDLILVRNEMWVKWTKDEQFALWEQRCNNILLDADPYIVSRCPADANVATVSGNLLKEQKRLP